MAEFRFCSLLIFVLGSSIALCKCNKSTAAILEEELKQHHEIPLHNTSLYDSGDILKWNCTDSKNQSLIKQDKNSSEQVPAESNVDKVFLKESPTDSDVFEASLTRNSSGLNSYVLIYRNILNPPADETFAPSSNIPVQINVNGTSNHNSTVSHSKITTESPELVPKQQGSEPNKTTYNGIILEETVSKNVSLDQNNRSSRNCSQHVLVTLLLGEKHGISFLNVTYPENSILLNKTDIDAFSVDYKFATGQIFFSENGTIRSTGQPSMRPTEVGGPVSLAVDWVHDRLYWMSDRHQTVEAADLDGNNRTLLIDSNTGIKFPNNIAVDPLKRVIFFAANNSMYKSDLQGLNLTKIDPQDDRSKTLRCLTLDVVSKRLFFTGKLVTSRRPYLASSDYEGEEVKFYDIGDTDWVDIYSLSVIKDVVYFAHYNPRLQDSVWFFNISWTGKRPVKVYEAPSSRGGIWSIRVFHSEIQRQSDKLGG